MSTSHHAGISEREVRLGVALYGGVSLAVYIYGTCVELLRLVRASQDLERGAGGDSAYTDLLRSTNARVGVDIVAGTSAGGLNGVSLAKALAQGGSLDALRRLWVEEGDLFQLLNPPGRKDVRSLLDTDKYHRMILEALTGIDQSARPERAQVKVLDLFVPTTDLYGRRVEQQDFLGEQLQTREHRKVFHQRLRTRGYNRYDPLLGYSHNDFGPGQNAALATICHATSAFPVAIAPARLDADPSGNTLLEQGDAPPLYLSDGGILDNKPFTEMLHTVFTRSADPPVDRVVLFVEPDPAPRELPPSAPRPESDFVSRALKAMLSIPRYESLAGDLRALNEHKERVRRFQEALEPHRAGVAAGRRSVALEPFPGGVPRFPGSPAHLPGVRSHEGQGGEGAADRPVPPGGWARQSGSAASV
ncbi:MAG: patatin-like protein [Dehalococcoidia bacterium]|nr:patatin-like protein [Dehalococcoidia bacterium]